MSRSWLGVKELEKYFFVLFIFLKNIKKVSALQNDTTFRLSALIFSL